MAEQFTEERSRGETAQTSNGRGNGQLHPETVPMPVWKEAAIWAPSHDLEFLMLPLRCRKKLNYNGSPAANIMRKGILVLRMSLKYKFLNRKYF